jgi:hypothetical protein
MKIAMAVMKLQQYNNSTTTIINCNNNNKLHFRIATIDNENLAFTQ